MTSLHACVVSLDAWCGGIYQSLARWLPAGDADVLCLQEVTPTPGYRGWVTYTDTDRTSRQRASLFHDVRHAIPARALRGRRGAPKALRDRHFRVRRTWR